MRNKFPKDELDYIEVDLKQFMSSFLAETIPTTLVSFILKQYLLIHMITMC